MDDDARNWIVKWKLVGMSNMLSPNLLVTLPEEAFEYARTFGCGVGDVWLAVTRGKHFFVVGRYGHANASVTRRRRWADARQCAVALLRQEGVEL